LIRESLRRAKVWNSIRESLSRESCLEVSP
jgi:hypothetical protein